jgi:hypothetical protein
LSGELIKDTVSRARTNAADFNVNLYFEYQVHWTPFERVTARDLMSWMDKHLVDDWSFDIFRTEDGQSKVFYSFKNGGDAMRFKLTFIGS